MHKLFSKLIKNFTILNLVLCVCCANCTHSVKHNGNSDISDIEIKENLSSHRIVNLSTVASNIEYCRLETDEKCLVTPAMAVYCSKDYIVTIGNEMSYAACYVFDRKSGNFVRQISNRGQGPGEYTETINSFWDGNKEQVCLWGNNQYLFFNLDGTLSHKVNRFSLEMERFVAYNDFYAGYVSNSFGNATTRIAFFDKTGSLVDSIPEYRSWKRTESSYKRYNDGWLYVFQDNLYYKDIFCDTLYRINALSLQPRYVFNTGGLAVPYEIQEGGRFDLRGLFTNEGIATDRYEKYVYILKIFEDNRHLYFTVEYKQQLYPAIYDKTESRLQVLTPVSIPPIKGKDWKIPLYGFENDLDGGLPFWPQQMISEKEMMCVYTPEELLGLDVSKITDVKLKNVLENLDEDSNPVVAIVTLK